MTSQNKFRQQAKVALVDPGYFNRVRVAKAVISHLGPVQTYPDIFEFVTDFFFPDTAFVHTYPGESEYF